MKKIVYSVCKSAANLHGKLVQWYLCQIYLPLVQRGQDIGKINSRLSNSDWRQTQLILRAMHAQIDPTAHVEDHLLIHNARPDYAHLQIGPGCYVGKDCFFDLSDRITLERNVTVAMRVTILTHFDAGNSTASKVYPLESRPVLFEMGAYVGAGATILPGVTVHQDAIVAAGAMVTEDVPAKVIVGGVPARFLKNLG